MSICEISFSCQPGYSLWVLTGVDVAFREPVIGADVPVKFFGSAACYYVQDRASPIAEWCRALQTDCLLILTTAECTGFEPVSSL